MKKHLKKILSVFMVIAMLLSSVATMVTYANAYTYIAYGIDVSAWQGSINWTSVKADGIDFAILRIMASGKDGYFETNYTNAKAAGVKLGVYCYSYADTVAEAQAEANKVLNWLGGRTLEYPIYYDIEDPNVHANLTNAQRTNLCIAFCDVIEAAGYRAGIYSGSYWFNSKLDRATLTAKYEIWEAMWPASNGVQVNSPIYDKSSTCGMWQYSSVGTVSGISGRVDMNVSYKDYAAYMVANGYNGYGTGTGNTTLNGYYQVTSAVNFRTGPGTTYDIIANLATGTQVAVVGFDSTGSWAKVVYGGNSGYISKNYLSYIRAFAYTMNYLTNNSTTMSAQSLRYGSVYTVPSPADDPNGNTFKGWQLLRQSDFAWYTGSAWVASQASSKLYQPGETITFEDAMFSSAAGDDNFYMCAVWGTSSSSGSDSSSITLVTPSVANPKDYGWQWPTAEAYGYMGNYGGNGQDIELSVDLCLLPSTETSVAAFYTDGTTKNMKISPTSVTVGSTTVSYTWGELSLDNWHNVKFKIYNGTGYVFIDGVQIASEAGMTANESYQLLFSLTGEMAIDNAIMMSSTGTTYFDCDFEDANEAETLMGEGLGARTLIGAVETVTPNTVAPYRYGWLWDESVSYGYFGNYGGNGQDVEFCVDLCLLPSDNGSKALFYTDGTSKYMSITASTVTVGSTSVSYDWGEESLDNWHDVKFKVYNGTGYVFIDGELIASEAGMTANTEYQLLFSYPGTMAVDNVLIMSSTGTTYFSCDYETSDCVTNMGESYGERVLLFPDTSDFEVVISPTVSTITGKGSTTFTAIPSAGENHTYSWSSSNSALNAYLSGINSDTCTLNITSELSSSFTAVLTCTVTSDGGVTRSGTTNVTYNTYPVPTISSVSPSTATITGTGTATYTATASGDGLTYKWTSSNSALNSYLSGTTSATLTVNIPAELSAALTSTLTCTVTNSYGKTATKTASFTYNTAPVPTISSISPASATITGTGSATFKATASGDGLTYKWTSSNSALNAYLSGTNTATLTVNIPAELSAALTSTLTCTVTNSYGKTATKTATLTYKTNEIPTVSAISPAVVSITGTGTATFTATATGTDLTYKWTSSESALDAYMTGADTDTLTITVPEELDAEFTATLTCTVTNAYGKTAEKTARLSYKLTPVPVIESITPSAASIEDTGSVTYTAVATGDGLTYSWSSSDAALDAYLSGTDTDTLTVNIPAELADSITATITLTVTNSYGNTATATAEFEYTVTLDGGFVVTMLGDIDGDGAINAKDTNTITRIVAGVVTATEAQMEAGDVNGDGDVNGIDANILARYAAGLITEF